MITIRKHGRDYENLKVRDVRWKDKKSGKIHQVSIAFRLMEGGETGIPAISLFAIDEGVVINIEDFNGVRDGIHKRIPLEDLKSGGIHYMCRKVEGISYEKPENTTNS